MIAIRSNGVFLHGLGPVSAPSYSFAWSGGCMSASWSMVLPVGFTHPALRQGSVVDLMVGPFVVWTGIMAEPDRVSWEFTADGFGVKAAKVAAVDSAGVPTTNITKIVSAAAARGWPLNSVGTVAPNAPLSVSSEDAANLNTLADVLVEHEKQTGERWAFGPYRDLRVAADPTAVKWALTPGTPGIPTVDDDYASTMYVRYVSAVSGSPAQPSAWGTQSSTDSRSATRWGLDEQIEDVSDLGLISSSDANTIAKAMLNAGKSKPSYTQGVTVSPGVLTTPGGTTPEFWQIGVGERLRHHGVLDSDGRVVFGKTPDWVIGSLSVDSSAKSVTIAPASLAPRTLASVMASQRRASARGFK